ncbi:MAG: type III-B CRISPR-associated protein Cas10/Cmr2 [Calditrichaeota bacterium]|nr:MAG: type III-B CRISPR-associated protein Cas10/Cmr2 [Calditrichota bacterium]
MKPNSYLFLYTIGPVQSFIARARKTRDLWSGSALLSELSLKTVLYAQQKFKAQPIFPRIDGGKKFMPNRFLVMIETDKIEEVGKQLEQYTRKLLEQRANDVLKHVKKMPPSFDEQIKKFLQIYWVAIPCENGEYPEKFSEIERLLAAVKNVRAFEPLREPQGRKCSLSGERIALFYNERNKPSGIVPEAVPVGGFRLTPGEALDAIGFLKRCYQPANADKSLSFPSTAEIALSEFLARFPKPQLLSDYKKLFEGEGYSFDAQLFFEENLTEQYFRKYGIEVDPEKAKELLEKIKKEAQKENLIFQKYYAIVMLDGDNVGAWLSGSKFNSKSKFSRDNLLEYHTHVSKQLGLYAQEVEKLFSAHKGKGALIYCGGDDVLAFVNLAHLAPILKNLREKLPDLDGTGRYTATAGVVIAHYKIPLSEVLKWVRKIEKEAKDRDQNKDKLAIAVLKHSGEIEKCVIPWYLLDNTPVLDILQKLHNAWRGELLSTNFVRQLFNSFHRLLDTEGDFMHKNLLSVEMERLVKRSVLNKGKTGEGKEYIDALVKQLNQFLVENPKLKDFMSFLGIADFMERKVK